MKNSWYHIIYRNGLYEVIDGFYDEDVFYVEIRDIKRENIKRFIEELKKIIEKTINDPSFLDYVVTPIKFIDTDVCSKLTVENWKTIYKGFRGLKMICFDPEEVKWVDCIAENSDRWVSVMPK